MATTKEEKSKDKKPLTLSRPGRLELNRTVEGGQVKQSFSHGRSKTVAVEVKKKRTFRQDAGGEMTEVKSKQPIEESPKEKPLKEVEEVEKKAETTTKARTLTETEQATRVRALEDARKAAELAVIEAEERAIEEAKLAEEEVKIKQAQEELKEEESKQESDVKIDASAEVTPPDIAEDKKKKETPKERKSKNVKDKGKTNKKAQNPPEVAGETAQEEINESILKAEELQASQVADTTKRSSVSSRRRTESEEEFGDEAEDSEVSSKPKGRGASGRSEERRTGGRNTEQKRRRRGKLTISEALDEDGGARQRSVAAFRRRQERERLKREAAGAQPKQKIVREVQIPEHISVGDLASRMAVRANEVIKSLMKNGVMATTSQTVDQETAQLVAEEFGHSVKLVTASDVEIGLGVMDAQDDSESSPRAPVVTIMGHVDHGKTSLLDALRETDIVSREAGGITQHIGAYQLEIASGDKITFLDTPGHAAFTQMRQRGANVTDLVVLVVAADDAVQPQTIEAINHARAADVPIIVALNKIDRNEADPTKIKNELLSQEIVPEELGGEVQCIEVSATEKTGLETLTEAIALQAEILELKANPDRMAYGSIVEAKLEKGRGAVATVLVQTGTLKVGDIFVAGAEWGRTRAIINDYGQNIDMAAPSMPVEVLGFNGTPQAGDDFAVVESESRAREITEYRQRILRDRRATAGARGTLDEMFEQISSGEVSLVPLVIKGDVQGSVEAIAGSLEKMSTDEVRVEVLHSGVGGINESDISLASASGGLVIGFNVRAIPKAREQAKRDGVDIRYYNIIYNVVDDVKLLLEGKLSPTLKESHLGNAEIREVFSVSKIGKVAGCLITAGTVRRGAKVRLLRDSVVVYEGELAQLKRFKDDVREVQNGYECGMALENYNDIQPGDVIECFEVEEIARQLSVG
ncbi:MAG: translation initiation factor IF-2 [Alphaproteobacteria bacterium]|nr:translation initiation factor IF-2 [Alphaproteobacteria bacterium]